MTTGTGEPAVARRRRWGPVQVALSAAAVLVIAGGALLTVRLVGGSDEQATGAAAGRLPAELTINGKTLHRQGATPIDSVHATDRAATRLLVLACCENPAVPSPCHPWTDVRVVGQDDRTITLAATTYVDRTGGPDVTCSGGGRGGGRFSVPLAAPLGTRRVVEDDRVLPVQLINSLLHATALPAGYAAPPSVEKDTQAPGLTISRYSGPDQDTRIEIYQGPVDQAATDPRVSGPTVLGRLTVRAHPAVFRQYPRFTDVRCLVWAETASTGVAVCSRGLPTAPLSAAQLATIAERLVRSR
ncbi:MAG TPA: hypothetical protein VI357_23435 [Mycobacteriales bacterium]